MKTFRLSHTLAVWAAILAALAMLSACDSAPTSSEPGTITPSDAPQNGIRYHQWEICGTPVYIAPTCPVCIFPLEKWGVVYQVSTKPTDTLFAEQIDTLTSCRAIGSFPDTARLVGLTTWSGDSLWFRIDDSITKPWVWKTRMNPDSVGYKAWGER